VGVETSYSEDWRILIDALRMSSRNFEVSDEALWITSGARKIKIEFGNGRSCLEIRFGDKCRKIQCSSEELLAFIARIGAVKLQNLIASAFINSGYEKVLKIRRTYEKTRI